MKKLIILFAVLFTLNNNLAQDRWLKLNGPEGGFPRSLKIFGDTIVAGIGDKGILYYSFNRGVNWSSSIKTSKALCDFVNANDTTMIFSVGNDGIFKSSDFRTYSRVYHNNNQYFICFIKDKMGILYAGTEAGNIYMSTNNGLTWSFSISNNTGYYINNFSELTDSTFLAGTENYIYSKKVGEEWHTFYVDTMFDARVATDWYDNIYAFNSGKIKMSTDKE